MSVLPLLLSALVGCAGCGRKAAGPAPVATPDAHPPPVDAAPPGAARATTEGEVFSSPIAAARIHGVDVVAGLVAAEGLVRAVAFAEGQTLWTTDALRGVKWVPDADLRAMPAGDGVALVWSGMINAKRARTLVQLGPDGAPRGSPMDIGAAHCGTVEGLSWLAPRGKGSTPVRARRWADADAHDVLTVPSDRDPSLVCGTHWVTVLGDGEDDVTATTFIPGEPPLHAPAVVLRHGDFGDDEREHEAYSLGDDLGLLRVGVSGALSMRTVPRAGDPHPWRKLDHAISEADEIVAVDGEEKTAVVVLTHEVEGACSKGALSAEAVQALRVSEGPVPSEALLDLAPPDCDRSPGPFWVAPAPGGPSVAWVERQTTAPAKGAAIGGLAFRVLSADGARAGHIEQAADAMVDAGCDAAGCRAAVLVRGPGSDGMRPAAIRVYAYP